ncbi:MAG: HEAT repeat domain-containing protein, partial [Planctomycetota bacterium]
SPSILRKQGPRRRIAAAIPALRRAVRAEGAEVRLAALEALGASAGIEDLDALVEAVLRPVAPGERGAAEEALRAACRRMPDRDATTERLVAAMSRAPAEGKALLLEALSAVAGAKALEFAVETAKSPEKPIRDAAFRALGDWPSEEAVPKLLALLRSSTGAEARLGAFRALSSVVRRLSFPSREERLGVCREAAELAKDAAERRIVIEALSGIPAPESLAMLRGWLADAELVEDACRAMVTISERLVRARAAAVVEPMEEVRRTTKDPDLAARAERVLAQAKGAMR